MELGLYVYIISNKSYPSGYQDVTLLPAAQVQCHAADRSRDAGGFSFSQAITIESDLSLMPTAGIPKNPGMF